MRGGNMIMVISCTCTTKMIVRFYLSPLLKYFKKIIKKNDNFLEFIISIFIFLSLGCLVVKALY